MFLDRPYLVGTDLSLRIKNDLAGMVDGRLLNLKAVS